jgi:hypothetical protein
MGLQKKSLELGASTLILRVIWIMNLFHSSVIAEPIVMFIMQNVHQRTERRGPVSSSGGRKFESRYPEIIDGPTCP